jgi:hypothetical protein
MLELNHIVFSGKVSPYTPLSSRASEAQTRDPYRVISEMGTPRVPCTTIKPCGYGSPRARG